MLVTMLSSGVALLLACLAFVAFDIVLFRKAMVEDLSALAQMIEDGSTASLLFNDPRSARETLAALKAKPHIVEACLTGGDGRLFAGYARSDAPAASDTCPVREGARFEGGYLDVGRIIVADGERIGGVHIRSDLGEMDARLKLFVAAVLAVMLVSAGIAFLVSARLHALVSDPIQRLAEAARRVSLDQDYAVRVSGAGGGEMGVLTGAFNEMLDQIQTRDAEL